MAGQAQGAELDLGQRAHVAGQQRLDDPDGPVAVGERGDGLCRAGQDPAPGPDIGRQLLRPGRLGCLERLDLAPRVRHARAGEQVDGDGPVGTPGHRDSGGRQAGAEHLPEGPLIDRAAGPSGIDEGLIDIPEHQQASHAGRLSRRAGGTGTPRSWLAEDGGQDRGRVGQVGQGGVRAGLRQLRHAEAARRHAYRPRT